MAISFVDHYSIKDKKLKFVNIPIDKEDLEAFICPFLIESNKTDKVVSRVKKRLTNFLTELNTNYIKKNDLKNATSFLDHLHEPNEYHLGYSKSNKGKAVSKLKTEQIFQFLRNNKFARQGISITNEAHNVLLLVAGIGQDIMSDIIANVCRDIFADFTTTICLKYSIQTTSTDIEYYSDKTKKWETKKINLPKYDKHIILIPNQLLSGGRAYSNHYNWYISSNYISKEILEQKTPPKGTFFEMKDGTKRAIIKEIYNQYRKPKRKLIDFVLKYPNSLDEFMDYAKTHYPELKIDHLIE